MIDFSRFNSLFALTTYFDTEAKCKKVIAESRWEKGDVVCPFCGEHHCTSRTDGRYHCAHFKRMVFGTYHFVTKKYLQRYIDESVYRFNTKELKASDRFVDMFAAAIGKIQYKDVRIAA